MDGRRSHEVVMPMRVFAVAALILLLLEAVLLLAFLAGFYWLGGWLPGVLLCAVVFLLLLLPWLGDLVVHYESAAGRVAVRMSWWGHMTYQGKPDRELRIRVLGIPWRKRMEERKPKEKPDVEPEVAQEARRRRRWGMMRWGRQNVEQLIRLLLTGLQAGHEMLCASKELRVRVGAPTQISYADQAIAGAVGRRRLGPLELRCAADGERRVTVHYRIGLLRAALTGLCVAAQAKPWKLARAMKAAQYAEPKEAQ